MDIAELSRRLENMIRFGTVGEVNHAARRVRVQTGDLLTQWLKWRAGRAGATRTWDPPTVGEQVMILSPSGVLENGIVMPSIYSDDHDTPDVSPNTHVTDYPDGARISYDHASGALVASGIQTALVEAAVSVTLDTPLVHCTHDLHVSGKATVEDLLTYGNGIAGTGGDNANIINGALIQTGGELSSEGTVLHTHTHPGDSGGTTGAPN